MATNRFNFFNLKNKNSKYINESVISALLCYINDYKNEVELYLNFDKETKKQKQFDAISNRVLDGEPYQYVIGKSFFLGNEFFVNKDVLIPRQETEQLVLDLVKKSRNLFGESNIKVCDLCTGSGIIAIELARRLDKSNIFATDIDEKALFVANKNAKIHKVDVMFKCGDLFLPILEDAPFDILVCNPPYIEDVSSIDAQVLKYEPKLALVSNPGTYFYERIFKNTEMIMSSKYLMAFEIGEDQKEKLEGLVKTILNNAKYEFKIDMYNKIRFLYVWKD